MGIYLKILIALFVLAPFAADASGLAKPPNNLGLKIYWTFNEGSGTRAIDYSSNSNYGTLVGSPSFIAGKSGNRTALDFNGSSNYVQASQAPGTTNVTISAWVRITAAPGSNGGIAGFLSALFGDGRKNLFVGTDGKLYFFTYDGATKTTSTPTDTIPLNTWVHVVGTADGTNLKTYMNGVEVGTVASGSLLDTYTFFVSGTSGSPATNGHGYLNADIDEVRMYDRALTAPQVVALYEQGYARLNASSATLTSGTTLGNGLVGHWTFDGADTLSSITDKSGNSKNGYFYGGATSTAKTAGKLGQALRFNGSTNYINTPTISIASSISASAWVHSSNFDQNGMVILKGAVNEQWELFFAADTNDLKWRGGGLSSVDCTPLPTNNAWHHIVATQTGTAAIVYVDGVVCNSNTVEAIANGSNGIAIGRFDDFGGSYYFNGMIDDVRLYNRVLSADEVKQLYRLGGGKVNASSVALQGPSLGNGLLGHWTFDGSKLTQNVADSSGAGNNAFLTSGFTSTTTAAGKLGQALNFDGSNDYVSLSSFAHNIGTGDFTFSAWVYPRRVTTNYDGIMSVGSFAPAMVVDAGATNQWGAFWGSNLPSGSILSTHTWYFLVMQREGTTVRFYRNGVVEPTTHTVSTSMANTTFQIGTNNSVGTALCDCIIDDPRVYNRALSAAEVLQLYRLGK